MKKISLKSKTFNYLSLLLFLLFNTLNTQAEDIITEAIPVIEGNGDSEYPIENSVEIDEMTICENLASFNNYVDFIQDMPILFLPVVTVNDSDEVYSLTFQGVEKNNELFMQLTDYCRIEDVDSIPNSVNPAILASVAEIYVPAVQIGNDNFSGYLHLDPLPTEDLPINYIFTQQTPPIFKIVGIQQKLKYPVLFVHGINSDGTTWDSYKSPWQADKRMSYGGNILITDKYHISELGDNANSNRTRKTPLSFLYEVEIEDGEAFSADFYTMNFSNNNDISFAAQGLQLREVVNQITEWTGKEGVYIVAHSMGGLASRAYLQYFNDEKVKGLITIGTPHFGSPFGSVGSAFVGDVAEQLQIASEDLAMLNDIETYPLPNGVKYFAVVVRGNDTAGEDNLYSDDSGDGIVPTYSQTMGVWDSQEVIIEEDEFTRIEVHTLETANPEIRNIVWDKLISW